MCEELLVGCHKFLVRKLYKYTPAYVYPFCQINSPFLRKNSKNVELI